MAKTGIEVKLVFPTEGPEFEQGKKFMEWVHKFHLDGLMKVAFDMNKMELRLDDAGKTREPMLNDHFIECEPGEHKLEVGISASPMPLSLQRRMSTRALVVTVERDHITTVQYTSGGSEAGHVEVLGRRPG